MPITRKQFEMGIDSKIEEWMAKIRAFFTERKDEAFTEEEIRQHFSASLIERLTDLEKKIIQTTATKDPFDILGDEKSAFESALETLVDFKAIEMREIRGTYYYCRLD